ncbi:TolC family protein [Sulfuricaulis sp.]|uniref:TolC family protein n=1 Tax=Sulfuricaulis sp. TaxID=2003553 RepID=UPI00355997A4
MKRNYAITIALAVGIVVSTVATVRPAHAAEALTLDEYFAAALKRSEVVATQGELIRQAEEHYKQADSALFPTVNGVASYARQDPIPAGDLPNASSPNRQSVAKLTATQPLFRGFREFAGLRQTKALVGAQNQDYLNARTQLFNDVVQNFYIVLSIEQDLKNFSEEINQNIDREKELNGRVRIGRSRISEVLSVQSTINTLRAQVEQLQSQLGTAREAFAFLSGLAPTTPLRDTEDLPATLEPLDDYLAQLEMRPDVKASQQRLSAAQENTTVARGANLPSLDLNANRYLERTGNLKDSNWDVGVALTVPIYAGGLLQSKVSEAVSQRTQAELSVSQVRRQAEQEIRSIYQSVVFDRLQLDALEKATESARKNYEAQRHDYRLGLVTNLDVLQALTAYQQNQRALDRARFTEKLDYLRLEAAVVRRPAPPQGPAP